MSTNQLDILRQEIDQLDAELLAVLHQRFAVCRQIALYKRDAVIPMMQSNRVQRVKDRARSLAASRGIDETFISAVYDLIIAEACRLEDRIIEAKQS
jgi:4-amino-4-deoxychorismate mutase